jgi:hypothetical protein
MTSPLNGRALPLSGPASDIVPVTPSDTNHLSHLASALFVEAGGVVVIETLAGSTRTISVPDFTTIPVLTSRVYASGTTATGIHALVTT